MIKNGWKRNVIISRAESISSPEIEECLYRPPRVLAAAVVGRPGTPCAFVLLRPASGGVTELELVDRCREHLALFKTPRTIVFGALARTSTGKIQKFVLRERARAL